MKKSDFEAKASPRRYKSIPLNGEAIELQSLTTGERRSMRRFFLTDGKWDEEKQDRYHEVVVGLTLVDTDRQRMYTDEDIEEGRLSALDDAIVQMLSKEAREFTGLDGDPDWNQLLESSAKNLSTTPTPDSPTA